MGKNLTPEEIETLKVDIKILHAEGLSFRQISKRLHKGIATILRHANALQLEANTALSSNDELEIVRLNEEGHTYTSIAHQLGKSLTTVWRYGDSQGLPDRSTVSSSDLSAIRILHGAGCNDFEIGEILDWDPSTIYIHRHDKLGLPGHFNTERTLASRAKKFRLTMKEQTGDLMSYRTLAHRVRAASLGWAGYKLNQSLILYLLGTEGEMKTPDIRAAAISIKRDRNWNPQTLSLATFRGDVSYLKRNGMVLSKYNGRAPSDYWLTDQAQEQFKKRVGNRIDYDRLERVLANDDSDEGYA